MALPLRLYALGASADGVSTLTDTLHQLTAFLASIAEPALVVAPEVALSGFDYDHFDAVAAFAPTAVEALLQACGEHICMLTLIVKDEARYYNEAVVLHQHRVIHQQRKENLFTLAKEHHYFTAGAPTSRRVSCEGLEIGLLICFELRFLAHWQALKGCDIICIMAYWGKARAAHLQTLSQALSVMHQCYVMVSDHTEHDAAAGSAIYYPDGTISSEQSIRDGFEVVTAPFDSRAIATIRRYIDVRKNDET